MKHRRLDLFIYLFIYLFALLLPPFYENENFPERAQVYLACSRER